VRANSMKEGFLESLRILRQYDLETTDVMLFGGRQPYREQQERWSCIPVVSEPLRLGDVEEDVVAGSHPATGMDEIFRKFEVACLQAAIESLQKEWITENDLAELAPFVILGIPGLVAFDVVRRSAETSPGKDVIVCSDTTTLITSESKPNHGIARAFWPKLIKAKTVLESTGTLTEKEVAWIRCKLLTNGTETVTNKAEEVLASLQDDDDKQRRRRMSVVSSFYSLAIDISRLSRTGGIIQRISTLNGSKQILSETNDQKV
jgi:hypothetical protein